MDLLLERNKLEFLEPLPTPLLLTPLLECLRRDQRNLLPDPTLIDLPQDPEQHLRLPDLGVPFAKEPFGELDEDVGRVGQLLDLAAIQRPHGHNRSNGIQLGIDIQIADGEGDQIEQVAY